jgi:hypothetical protein
MPLDAVTELIVAAARAHAEASQGVTARL